MESFYTRYKNALVLMLVLLAQIVLLAMQVRRPAPGLPDGHNVRLWRYVVSSIIAPPERLAHNVGLSVRGVWSRYIYLRDLRKQNDDLQAENDRLRLEQASLAEDARAGQRLREMLDFRGQYIDKTLPAQVIGTSGTDQARVIYIDRGSKDGLKVQMPVITPDGIIGKLKNVFPSTSQVLLISDQTSGTGVMLQTTRVRGVMKGNASGQPQIVNISPDDRIKPGEPVMTSGGDQVYPAGLPVGVVDRVEADPDTPYVNVVIKPNANLSRLEEVLVVTELSDKMPFSQEKDMMQSEVDALALKQRAADVLSERLPSLHELNANQTVGETERADAAAAEGAASAGDPARPMRPPQPLHPDRYSPGQAPAAESLTPGAGPPPPHRAPSTETSASDASTGSKPAAPSAAEAAASERGFVLMSRFPPKPAAPKPSAPAPAGDAGASGSSPVNSTAAAAGSSSAKTGSVPNTASGGVAVAAGVKTSVTAKPANATAGGTSGASSAGASAALPRVVRPAGTAAAPTGSTSTAPKGPAGGASGVGGSNPPPPPRRSSVSPDDSDGILAPAGMGTIGGAPRPRPSPPANATTGTGSGSGAAGASAGRPSAPKLPASPSTTGPTSKPATTPGQQPAPAGQKTPKPAPASAPPGGA
jgi:rod shape-determining protein MreC